MDVTPRVLRKRQQNRWPGPNGSAVAGVTAALTIEGSSKKREGDEEMRPRRQCETCGKSEQKEEERKKEGR